MAPLQQLMLHVNCPQQARNWARHIWTLKFRAISEHLPTVHCSGDGCKRKHEWDICSELVGFCGSPQSPCHWYAVIWRFGDSEWNIISFFHNHQPASRRRCFSKKYKILKQSGIVLNFPHKLNACWQMEPQ